MTRKYCWPALYGIGLVLWLAGTAVPGHASTIVARVDGAVITIEDIKLALEDIGRTLPRQMSGAQRQAYVINYLVDMKLAANQARKDNLDKSPEFEKRRAYFQERALMEAYMDRLKREASSEAGIRKVYEDAAKDHKPETEVRASHILVETRENAETALKRISTGEDFAKVAREISKDPGSPGGSLGWFSKDRMVPPFAEMAFRTPVGTISEPVQSKFGWHIIKVEDRRESSFPKLEAIRGQIESFLAQQAQRSAIEKLRNAANIDRNGSDSKK